MLQGFAHPGSNPGCDAPHCVGSGTSPTFSGPQLLYLLNGGTDECHSTIFGKDMGLEEGQRWVGKRDDSSKFQVPVKCVNRVHLQERIDQINVDCKPFGPVSAR